MTLPLFTLPEPPAEAVAQALDELRDARRELDEARRVAVMLDRFKSDEQPTEFQWRRLCIEHLTAEHRVELWAAEVRRAENRARALGLDVTSTL